MNNNYTIHISSIIIILNTKFEPMWQLKIIIIGSPAVECQTRNQVSPGSKTPLLPFRRLGISVLSIDALVDSAV